MKKTLLCACFIWILSACQSTTQQPPLLDDPRVETAKNFEQAGRLHDALIQWKILHTLYPDSEEIDTQKRKLGDKISNRIAQLKKQLVALDKNDKKLIPKRKKLLLKVLALNPNDKDAKEQLRDKETTIALQKATEKTQRIVEYFKENQSKAKKAIELSATLEQGDAFIRSKKFSSLLQLADKLSKASPKHKKIKEYRYTAYYGKAQEAENETNFLQAIKHYERAISFSNPQQKQTISKRVAKIRNQTSEDFYQKGVKVFKHNLQEAIKFFEEALRFDQEHEKAKVQLKRAQTMQDNLNRIRGASR